jgi:hypothetical protein
MTVVNGWPSRAHPWASRPITLIAVEKLLTSASCWLCFMLVENSARPQLF